MQQEVGRAMLYAAQVDLGHETEAADIIEDFGFHHSYNDVLSCWFALRNWHVLPCAGGWLDQPLAWRDDLQTLQAVYNETVDVLRDKILVIPAGPPRDDDTGAEIKLGIFADGP